jgi:hypothetical protein
VQVGELQLLAFFQALGVWLFADSRSKSYAKCINIQIGLGFIYAIIGLAVGGKEEASKLL